MNNEAIKSFALDLLRADSEEEVISVLKKSGYWDDPEAWRLCGDLDGNFATIGNQQARPDAALVEKLVNSVDARLMNECLVVGIDPESDKAPRSISHAISALFDGKPMNAAEGSISDWTSRKLLEQAHQITVAVTGYKPKQGMPCVSITDTGEGQSPGRFADTFLSINKANKLRIPFVQGKFNMGGTGVLKFCGRTSLQLIISRRNPKIIERWKGTATKWASADPRDAEWGVTIVRRERPTGAAGDVRNSIFRYLAPIKGSGGQSQVLSFSSSTLPLLPDENRPYAREAGHGTVIKLYEYDMKGFQSQVLMKGGLLSRLEALLPQIALPVRVHECRPYRGEEARSFENTLVGLVQRLGENRGDNVEEGYPTTSSFVVRNERMTAQIYAFIGDKAESYRTNEGIIFAINGQTHGSIPKTFFERSRVKMGRLAKSLLVFVDCSGMSVGAREDLFMNSRDRLSNGELRKLIEEELEDIIGKHEGLRALREKRRSEEIADRLEESKPLEQILDSILKSSPTLSKLFLFGQRLSRPHKAEKDDHKGGGKGNGGGEAPFEPKAQPTYFRFHKKNYGEQLARTAEIDRRCRIKFETDAPNDYFERGHHRGSYELEVIDGALEGAELSHSVTIHNGIANWSVTIPEEQVEAGDVVTLQCTVKDDTLLDPFVNLARITMTAMDKREPGDRDRKRLTNASGGTDGEGGTGLNGKGGTTQGPGAKLSGGIQMPPIVPVKRDDPNWKRHSFDDYTACKVIDDGEDGVAKYAFYVNKDNVYLTTELKDSRSDVAVQETKFFWANVLVGLALIHEDRQRPAKFPRPNGEEEKEVETVFARIDKTTRALGPFLIPMIDQLGAITEQDVAAMAQRGDDD